MTESHILRTLSYTVYMKNSTLLFLVKKTDGKITEVCLAMKKRGFGIGRWNGVGGKVEDGESIKDATIREAKEEIGITASDLQKVGEIAFSFKFKPDYNQLVHIYITESWEGEPIESEEMSPAWYKADELPYTTMWPDDIFWLPKVLDGEKIKAWFTFGEQDTILEQKVEIGDWNL